MNGAHPHKNHYSNSQFVKHLFNSICERHIHGPSLMEVDWGPKILENTQVDWGVHQHDALYDYPCCFSHINPNSHSIFKPHLSTQTVVPNTSSHVDNENSTPMGSIITQLMNQALWRLIGDPNIATLTVYSNATLFTVNISTNSSITMKQPTLDSVSRKLTGILSYSILMSTNKSTNESTTPVSFYNYTKLTMMETLQ